MRGLALTICLPTRSTRRAVSWVAGGACLKDAGWVRPTFPNELAETVVSFLSSERQPAAASSNPDSSSVMHAFMVSLPPLSLAAPEEPGPRLYERFRRRGG